MYLLPLLTGFLYNIGVHMPEGVSPFCIFAPHGIKLVAKGEVAKMAFGLSYWQIDIQFDKELCNNNVQR